MLAGGSACPTQDLLLLDAFEDHGAVVLPCIGLGGDGDFVALDDARADELGGSAAHVRLDEEGDLVAHHLAIAQRQIARRRGNGAGQLFTVLLENKSQVERVVTHLHGSGPVARNIGSQYRPGKKHTEYRSGQKNSSSHASHSTACVFG